MRHVQNALQYLGYMRDDQAYQVQTSSKRRPKAGTSRNFDVSFSQLSIAPGEQVVQEHRSRASSRNESRCNSRNESRLGHGSSRASSSQGYYAWSEKSFDERPEVVRARERKFDDRSQRYQEVERPQWAPGRLTTTKPLTGKDAPPWTERHHVSNSMNNPILFYLQRCYFDKLPTAKVDQLSRFHSSKARAKFRAVHGTKTERSSIHSLPSPSKDRSGVGSKTTTIDPEEPPISNKDQRWSSRESCFRSSIQEPEILKKLEEHLEVEHDDSRIQKAPGLREFVVFYHWCIQKFSNLTRCWRVLDSDLNMRIPRDEFVRSLRECHFRGNAQLVFDLLDRDRSGHLQYYHFDPSGALELAELSNWANQRFGCFRAAFRKLDTDGNGKLTLQEFTAGALKYGLAAAGPINSLFNMLDLDRDKKVTLEEFQFLDACNFPVWLTVAPDYDGAYRFTQALLHIYKNNCILAWRLGLDFDGNMRVSWEEFEKAVHEHPTIVEACQCTSLPRVWRAFDENLSGWLSVREFSREAYDLLVAFKSHCVAYHGSVSKAFRFLDVNKRQNISRKEFDQVDAWFQDEGRELNMSTLFDGLDLHQLGLVTLADLKYLDQWDVASENLDEEFWAEIAACLRSKESKRVSFHEY